MCEKVERCLDILGIYNSHFDIFKVKMASLFGLVLKTTCGRTENQWNGRTINQVATYKIQVYSSCIERCF